MEQVNEKMNDMNVEPKKLSASALKKQAKEAEKQRKKEEIRQRLELEKAEREAADFARAHYGELKLIQSTERTNRVWQDISSLSLDQVGQRVLIRARLQNARGSGKQAFIVLRQREHTVQGILSVDESNVSKGMVKFAASVPKESIVQVEGAVVKVAEQVESCSQHDLEIHIDRFFIVSKALRIPMTIEDASRNELVKQVEDDDGQALPIVPLDTRLNHRIIDLRTLTNQSIFKVQSGVCQLFREYLLSIGFQEIHTPKMISTASEGGASVFKINYFKGEAFLAQSPQFFKQMAICSDFGRVFEIGPVFRAENSLTHRHMTEFTGLDLEMEFKEHYHEVLTVIGDTFKYIFKGLETKFTFELENIRKQYPFEPFQYLEETLILTFSQGVAMLREAGEEMGDYEDLSTAKERILGKLVKEKYNTDFFILDRFPSSVRPFYTMPDPADPVLSV